MIDLLNDLLCICGHRESIHYGQGSCKEFAVCECPQFDEFEDADVDDDAGYR